MTQQEWRTQPWRVEALDPTKYELLNDTEPEQPR